MPGESLASLARMTATKRPLAEHPYLRGPGSKRTALYVGTGMFVAASAAVLTFFLLRANNSVASPSDAHAASIQQLAPATAIPWSTNKQAGQGQQLNLPHQPFPNRTNGATPTGTPAPPQFATEAAHPGPPQPNPPPAPSEPPSIESLRAQASAATPYDPDADQ
jgi:hypothetical protein